MYAPFTLTETVRTFSEVIQIKVVGLQSAGDSDAGATGTNMLNLLPLRVSAVSAAATVTTSTTSTPSAVVCAPSISSQSLFHSVVYESSFRSPILTETASTQSAQDTVEMGPNETIESAEAAIETSTAINHADTSTMSVQQLDLSTTPRQFFNTSSQQRSSNARRANKRRFMDAQSQRSDNSNPLLDTNRIAFLDAEAQHRKELHAIEMQIKEEELQTKRAFRSQMTAFMDLAYAKLQQNSVFHLSSFFCLDHFCHHLSASPTFSFP